MCSSMYFPLLVLLAVSLAWFPLRAQDGAEPMPAPVAEEAATEESETEEEADAAEPDASDDTAAEALVASLKERFAVLAELLSRVQDADSAAALQPEVQQRFAMLLTTDAAALADADEEELAAEFAEAFAPIDAELARLEEAEFFGCDALRAVFADAEDAVETEDGNYIFPLGPLDFLRGNKVQERQVCPRHEGGLQLFDWSQE